MSHEVRGRGPTDVEDGSVRGGKTMTLEIGPSMAGAMPIDIDEPQANQVEAALLAHPLVADCAVIARATPAGDPLCVAYLVVSEPGARADIARFLRSRFPNSPAIEQVHLSALPLLSSGVIDDDALKALPVFSQDVISHARVRAMTGEPQVSLDVRDYARQRHALHLSDLVAAPEGNDRSADSSAPSPMRAPEASANTAAGAVGPLAMPLAMIDGGPCEIEPGSPATLSESLMRAAQKFGGQSLVYIQSDGSETAQSYAGLLADAQRVCGGLRSAGRRAGDKILFQLDRTDDFIAAFWGCTLAGAVPVPVTIAPVYESGNPAAAKLRHAWEMLDDPLILTTTSLASSIRSFCSREGMTGARVSVIEDLRRHAADPACHAAAPEDIALIMLTSGSTGAPKCVLLTHGNLIAMSAGVQRKSRFTDRDVTLNWMAMDHVAGIVFSHLRDVFLGCRQVHAPTDSVLQRPTTWLDWLDRYRVSIAFAPNFAYGLINRHAAEIAAGSWDLSCVRSMLNGGEPVVARTARRFLSLLEPHGLNRDAMVPVWGMSETSSGVMFFSGFSVHGTTDEDPFVMVGEPIPGFAVRLVDDLDRVVGEGAVGSLQVKGAVVTQGYYKRPDLNQQVFTADGWFNTGDLAVIRQGQLAITGRAKDDIVINGVKYQSHDVEAAVDELDAVVSSFTAACGVRRPGADTEELAVFCVPSNRDELAIATLVKDIRRRVASRIGVSPSYVIAVGREEVPKTAIGKIQRAQLRERFEAGAFAARIKQYDIVTENSNTLPDWFFKTTWRQKALRPRAPERSTVVIFGDPIGLAVSMGKELETRGVPFVAVEPGPAFEKIDSATYRIRPSEPGDYRYLLDGLAADGVDPTEFVHAWSYGPVAPGAPGASGAPGAVDRDRPLTSVLFLAQVLAARPSAQGRRLTVATSHARLVTADEPIDFARTAATGLLRTIELELPSMRATHVDLQADDCAADAARVVDELFAIDREPEVAYRDGRRWVSRLERLDLAHADVRPLSFKMGGMYLLTGGLGGVGVEIATLLLKRFAARLLVVGRTPINDGSDADLTTVISERTASLRALQTIAASGGAVHYEAADVTDPTRVGEVVAAARSRWQCGLDGVIHLAGVFKDRLLDEETAETFAQTLAPKLDGALALDRVLSEQGGSVFVSFSSVTGFLGRVGGGAYAAANSFQDAFARVQRRRGVDAYCLAWSAWDDTGMIRGYPTMAGQAKGYFALSKTQGLNSFLAALHGGEPVACIGLDARSAAVRSRVAGESYAIERLHATATSSTRLPHAVTFDDPFGHLVTCDVEQTRAVDQRDSGTVATRSAVAPRTEMERVVAQTWQEVLNIADADVNSTFFELGGSSLLFARVYAALRQRVHGEISMTEMFRHPTIGALAAHLAGLGDGEPGRLALDRDRGRERRLKTLRAKRPAPNAS